MLVKGGPISALGQKRTWQPASLCPLRARSGHVQCNRPWPLYPRRRSFFALSDAASSIARKLPPTSTARRLQSVAITVGLAFLGDIAEMAKLLGNSLVGVAGFAIVFSRH